jgi:hypothetical protein
MGPIQYLLAAARATIIVELTNGKLSRLEVSLVNKF